MFDRLSRHLYERLGARYKLVFIATQGPAAVFVALIALAVLVSFYHPSLGETELILLAGAVFTMLGVAFAAFRSQVWLERVVAWRENEHPSDEETIAAWDAAVNYPMRAFRRDSLRVNSIAALPSVAVIVLVLDLQWWTAPVVLGACVAPAAYATILNYSIAELLLRPATQEIAAALPEGFPFEIRGLPVRKRFTIALPAFTAMTGLAVGALVTDNGGTGLLAVTVLASIGIGLALSWELTVLLSGAITDPIARLRAALARVRAGDYDARVLVTTSDELGELSNDFNSMARGLAEREELRETFGTYVDKSVARLLLSGQFPLEGVEVEVSIMFCDVIGFTSYAERSQASEVVASLNAMFETIVPIIDRHGGHVDKFIGDGLLAVFGAPEGYADHADRALKAAGDIVDAVNRPGAALCIAAGINSGRVIAGSIGGAGRLNFSVIGDAVNVAARVEAATRETGDDVLLTAATRDALVHQVPLASRGSVSLKGKSQPVEVLAPLVAAEAIVPAAR